MGWIACDGGADELESGGGVIGREGGKKWSLVFL